MKKLILSSRSIFFVLLCFSNWANANSSFFTPVRPEPSTASSAALAPTATSAATNTTTSSPTTSRPGTSSYGAISGGLAGSGLSSVDAGESYIINPGALAHLRGAAITFGTSNFQSTPTTENGYPTTNEGWHLSLNENSPDSIIASSIFVSKSRSRDKTPNTASLSSNDAWLTFGNFVMPQLAAGINYHFRDTQDPLKNYQEHNFGLGFLWTPLENLGVGFSFLNVNPSPKEVPAAYAMGSTTGIGLLYIHKSFIRLRLDYSKKEHELASMAYTETALGLETALSEWISSRVGMAQQKTETNEHFQKYSFGLGFSGPMFGIHYAFQQYQQALKGKEHNLDIIIPF